MADKRVQIPEQLLLRTWVLMHILEDYDLGDEVNRAVVRINGEITDYYDRKERRKQYTTYKTARSDDIREQARQKYLDMVGMHKDWRWTPEQDPNNQRPDTTCIIID